MGMAVIASLALLMLLKLDYRPAGYRSYVHCVLLCRWMRTRVKGRVAVLQRGLAGVSKTDTPRIAA
jgi:hypothetical protein